MEFNCRMKNGFEDGLDEKLQIPLKRKKVVRRLIIVSMEYRVNERIYLGIEKEEKKGTPEEEFSAREEGIHSSFHRQRSKRSMPAYQCAWLSINQSLHSHVTR